MPLIVARLGGLHNSVRIAIFEKIRKAHIFVCDVSIINQGTDFKKTPNPNVLIELGYAMMALGNAKIIMIFNKAYGVPKDLPFDLQRIRIVSYELPSSHPDKAGVRKNLEGQLDQQLRLILRDIDGDVPVEVKGADLVFQAQFSPPSASSQGIPWKQTRLSVKITSRNHIASENGVLRLTIAYPMQFSEFVGEIFVSQVISTGFFADQREDNPHAQTIRVQWNATKGTTIFPGEWHDFYNNAFTINIPGDSVIEDPVFIFRIELFTVDSPSKSFNLYAQLSTSANALLIQELPPTNNDEVMEKFWQTYRKTREFSANLSKEIAENHKRMFGEYDESW